MKLKKLKSIGHNTAASYLSALSLIKGKYTSTILHRLILKEKIPSLELDIINSKAAPVEISIDIKTSLIQLKDQFKYLLIKEGIPIEAIKEYKLIVKALGERMDVVDICCQPIIIDFNNKNHDCALIFVKYTDPIELTKS